jgi:hypothetical protein
MCSEELTGRVCAIDLEAFIWAREFLDETEIVKCGRDIEEFRIEVKLSLTALLSREQVDAHRVIKEQIRRIRAHTAGEIERRHMLIAQLKTLFRVSNDEVLVPLVTNPANYLISI